MYVDPNCKTKKALKERVAAGKPVSVYQPNDMFNAPLGDGWHTVEGPHFPEPHKWYANVFVVAGVVTKVK